MLEKQRLTYLEQLGIDNYVPRRILVGAASSQLLSDEALVEPTAFSTADMPVMGQEAVQASDLSAATETIHNPTPAVSGLAEFLDQKSMGDTVVNRPIVDSVGVDTKGSERAEIGRAETGHVKTDSIMVDQPAQTNKEPVLQAEAIRFVLNVWRINDSFLVIDSRQPATALPTDKLLQNILRAIGHSMAQLPASELLRWPLFKSNDASPAQEEVEARAMVQAYISAQFSKLSTPVYDQEISDSVSQATLQKAPKKILLLLGENAVRFALDTGADSHSFFDQHQGQAITESPWEASVLIAPSLVDMLQAPLRKRVTWQALQTLFL